MQLKCTKDNNGYYEVDECHDVVDRVGNYLIIEVNKGWTYSKNMKVEIHCTDEEFEDKFIRNSDAEFIIIDD